ncbi:ATP-binding protein [Paraburkholderia caballeronis]|uniref:histidine kinase n=1 Tax=Paraburkholderia caballeronis TaxID=416943 RepID=A0A1H7STK0_9BURK|nr:ATP-binding protein [Paraburkholderia caballeronis]PXW25645.1 signal transduction histidine kinase [Paraburkholderia caballeronis]PXX01252.1 signal transduction histidine kinase [Paraburkholderia caballeronis]RAJ99395.1 signal transduction histidine kinase [Paraburkholderia caballeronis]SEE28972.1 Signal transduction histidine kinase [Paraburkholderia caballeronis]SEL75950.1 Signal transduction histidine kinase [Paraburkholderia caballeronis]
MMTRLLRLRVERERDVVGARRQARALAAALGFSALDQARIASAVSEIARNALDYAGRGDVAFGFDERDAAQALVVEIADRGPGIRDLDAASGGRLRSPHGMGVGIAGSRRLMDRFEIRSAAGDGTTVTMARALPPDRPAVSASQLNQVVREMAALQNDDASLGEMRQQNRELIAALDELRNRQEELARLTQELEATNRGVVALYGELDERAEELRRADQMKTRFLSNVSHELRTPLSSIRALANLLLNRLDGSLTGEQDHQVRLILSAAEGLGEAVDDLLDLAKIEAGKADVQLSRFEPDALFAALRTTLSPLLATPDVSLEFEPVAHLPALVSDEPKLTQILRNFVSNALKYTERGTIRVGARLEAGNKARNERITFFVADTGIGIAQEDHPIIFEEFGQVQNPLQQRVKGTGLGLPLCRKLAALLGGGVGVESEPGRGSTFHVTLPVRLDEPDDADREATDMPTDDALRRGLAP